MRNQIVSLSAAAVALLFTSSVAGGDDQKTLPGATCQPYEDSDVLYDSLVVYADPSVGDYEEEVVCPVVRDRITNTDGTNSVWLRYDDTRDDDSVWCYFLATNWDGSSVTSVFASSGTSEVGTGSLGLDIDNSFSGGQYALWCGLPDNSAIVSYRVDEWTPTD